MTIEQNAKTKPLDSNKSTAKTESVEFNLIYFRDGSSHAGLYRVSRTDD